jgi:hypothetical protein
VWRLGKREENTAVRYVDFEAKRAIGKLGRGPRFFAVVGFGSNPPPPPLQFAKAGCTIEEKKERRKGGVAIAAG